MANSVGAVCSGSMLFASILNSSLMLGNYLQQMSTSADDIFRCFLGALRVNNLFHSGQLLWLTMETLMKCRICKMAFHQNLHCL